MSDTTDVIVIVIPTAVAVAIAGALGVQYWRRRRKAPAEDHNSGPA
jgi:hypothetical protein